MAIHNTEQDKFPYDKLTFQEGNKPEMTPNGCSMPYTLAAYPKIYVPWNHLTAAFADPLRQAIMASPESFVAVIPLGAGPKWYADNPRADLMLKEFLNAIEFKKKGSPRSFLPFETKEPKKGKDGEIWLKRSAFEKPWPVVIEGIAEEFRDYLLWQQTFATQSRIMWNFVPFDPKSLPWIIGSYQGNIISNDKDNIAEALACLKLEVWKSTAIQNLVKRIRQFQGKTGHPIDSVVEMTKSWRLVYIKTKNLDNDKGAVWSLMGLPITSDISKH
ncbi:hypothetical protein CPB85DRAFT_1441015 [Mucidula mucida]|nr:hypothetical protein CPB85DRAFT_1441015 [Mucidula mucida]